MTRASESLYLGVTICIDLESSLFCLYFIPFLVLQRTLGSLKDHWFLYWSYLVSAQYHKVSVSSFSLAVQRAGLFWIRIESHSGKPFCQILDPQLFHHQKDQDELDDI